MRFHLDTSEIFIPDNKPIEEAFDSNNPSRYFRTSRRFGNHGGSTHLGMFSTKR